MKIQPSFMGLRLSLFIAATYFGVTGSMIGKEVVPADVPSAADWNTYFEVKKQLAEGKPADLVPRKKAAVWNRVNVFLDRGESVQLSVAAFNAELNPASSTEPFRLVQIKRFAEAPPPTPPRAASSPTWKWPLLRQSYSDILSAEDPAQDPSAEKFSDLKGATLSYVRDRKSSKDMWAAQAALILPLVWTKSSSRTPQEVRDALARERGEYVEKKDGDVAQTEDKIWRPISFGIVPSISIHRVTTEERSPTDTSDDEADSLTYRVGVFGKWKTTIPVMPALTARGYVAVETTTGHRRGIPAMQFELEPKFNFAPRAGTGRSIALVRGALSSDASSEKYYDNDLIRYQLRLRGRLEVGRALRDSVPEGGKRLFVRAGPLLELTLDPFLHKRIALSAGYSYLPSLTGPGDRDTLFTAGAEFRLYSNEDTGHTFSIKATYTKGGIELSQTKVNTFEIGLAGTF